MLETYDFPQCCLGLAMDQANAAKDFDTSLQKSKAGTLQMNLPDVWSRRNQQNLARESGLSEKQPQSGKWFTYIDLVFVHDDDAFGSDRQQWENLFALCNFCCLSKLKTPVKQRTQPRGKWLEQKKRSKADQKADWNE